MSTNNYEPACLSLYHSGELTRRVERAYARLSSCDLCPQACRVNRQINRGVCQTGIKALVASYQPHFGEEPPLRGRHGSGTIFFAGCNLKCRFCQNYDISWLGQGSKTEPATIAAMMLELQAAGCHNVNFVSPSHVVPMILAAIEIAVAGGLQIPLVYNSGGYDSLTTLELLNGVIDIYLPDMKYADRAVAGKYSGNEDYPVVNQAAVKRMHQQVGDLLLDAEGIARRGLLVRHLVLPEGLAGTATIAGFLARELSLQTYVNVMSQYRPAYRAWELPPLDRPTTAVEHREALAIMRTAGLSRLDD